jgi:hypothetical protein
MTKSLSLPVQMGVRLRVSLLWLCRLFQPLRVLRQSQAMQTLICRLLRSRTSTSRFVIWRSTSSQCGGLSQSQNWKHRRSSQERQSSLVVTLRPRPGALVHCFNLNTKLLALSQMTYCGQIGTKFSIENGSRRLDLVWSSDWENVGNS